MAWGAPATAFAVGYLLMAISRQVKRGQIGEIKQAVLFQSHTENANIQSKTF